MLFTTTRMVTIKNSDNNKCYRRCRDVGNFIPADEIVKWCSLFGKQAVLQNVKNTVTIRHRHFAPKYIHIYICLREIKRYIHTHKNLFIAPLLTLATKWKHLKCPPTDEWINKMWYIHRVEYYSAMKRNGVLTHNIPGMNLENMLSERSQPSSVTIYYIPHLYEMFTIGKSIDTESRLVVAIGWGWGGRKWGETVMGRAFFWG